MNQLNSEQIKEKLSNCDWDMSKLTLNEQIRHYELKLEELGRFPNRSEYTKIRILTRIKWLKFERDNPIEFKVKSLLYEQICHFCEQFPLWVWNLFYGGKSNE